MAIQENVKLLKILVISMGLLLLGGMVVIGGVVLKKLSRDNTVDCAGGHLDLTGHGTIIESRAEEQLVRLTLEKQPGKDEIVTIDTCTGKVIGTLTLDTDPGLVQE